MSDAMSDKDDKCEGCTKWMGSYSLFPCNACSRVFSGQTKNWYDSGGFDGCIKYEEDNLEQVKHPKHYMLGNMEVIDIIKSTLTKEQFNGFLLGNILKYRLRAGKKGDIQEDIQKALMYEEMWDMYNG